MPALQHNGQSSNPRNRWAKLMAPLTSKQKKTDADLLLQAELQFKSALYCRDEEAGTGIVWPNENVVSMLKTAGKNYRLGKKANLSMIVRSDLHDLLYDGPRSRDELWEDERFRFTSRVRSDKKTNVLTRPIFHDWACEVSVWFDDGQLSEENLRRLFEFAGKYIGLSAWQGRFGMFTPKFKGITVIQKGGFDGGDNGKGSDEIGTVQGRSRKAS